MSNKLKISNGLLLDFTLAAAGVSDNFLGVDANGSPTYFSSIPVNRIAAQTINRAATFNASGFLAPSATTTTELGYVSGVTSAIQTQLNSKQAIISLTPNRAVVSSGAGGLTVSATTDTEISYVSGVTSAIQTQINSKQATITGGASSIVSSNLTVNRALVSDGSGKVSVSTVTNTQLGYVSGVTSAIQTQLNTKLTVTLTSPASGDVITYDGANWVNSPTAAVGVPTGGTTGQFLVKQSNTNYDTVWHTLVMANVSDVSATATEINLLSGVTTSSAQFNYLNTTTSNVQSQLNAKLPTALAQNAMWIGNASNIAVQLAPGTSGYVLTSVSGVPTWQPAPGGGGGIAGPGTSTDNAIVRWDGTLGTTVQDSVVVVDDTGIVTGATWHGNVIVGQYGGTGVANTGKTITLGGNLTTSGAFASTFTMTGTTTVTFPTSGTLMSDASLANGNGTTWTSGTPAYDWGGTLSSDVVIDGTFSLLFGQGTSLNEMHLITNGSQNDWTLDNGTDYTALLQTPTLIQLAAHGPDHVVMGVAYDASSVSQSFGYIGAGFDFIYLGDDSQATGTRGFTVYTGSASFIKRLQITEAGVWTRNFGSDATGDVYYRNASGNETRLPIGSANTILGAANSGGIPEYKTVSNGLTAASGSIKLGGTLTGTTLIEGTQNLQFGTVTPLAAVQFYAAQFTLVYPSSGAPTQGLTIGSGGVTSLGSTNLHASTTAAPSLNMPHGTAPTSPTNGDWWTTTAGAFVRINGSTVGPLGTGGGTPGGSNTQIQFNNSSAFGGNSNFTINNGTGVVTFGVAPIFSASFTLPNGTIGTTQSAGDNSTKVATTAYVDNVTLSAFSSTLDGFVIASGGVAGTYLDQSNAFSIPPGVPGGSTNQIQFNNGVSGFGGFGSYSGGVATIPAMAYSRINPSGGFQVEKYLAFTTVSLSGLTQNINMDNIASIPNDSMLTVIADIVGVQTSGTPGSSGFGMRLRARFRKNNSGTYVIVGTSVQENVDNDTGDSFAATPTLSASGGSLFLNISLTTAKTFSTTVWIEAFITQ